MNEVVRSLLGKMRANVIAYDVYVVIVMAVYCILAIVYYPSVPGALAVLQQDIIITIAIVALVLVWTITEHGLFGMLRRFYVIPVIYLMYDQVHVFVRAVHPVDYDDLLIEADRWLFGTDPTVWLAQWSFPALTEYLQVCYFLFYLLPIMHAVELWRRHDMDRLDTFARAMTFCYFISYLAYFVMPAIGPRFTIHDFSLINTDLPGLLFTPVLRDLIDVGGGIGRGVVDPALVVNRDCMPSGHTWLTLVNIILGFRFRSKFRWVFFLIGGSLIFSTVYLRYHYVVDLIVGALLAVVTLRLEPSANAAIRKWLTGDVTVDKSR